MDFGSIVLLAMLGLVVLGAGAAIASSYASRRREERARQQALERRQRALNEPVAPSPRVEDERARRMLALAAIRRLTGGDLEAFAYTDRLAKELGWDGATLSRVLNFQQRKKLLTVERGHYELGQRLRLTVAGLEEVEWSIMNPLHGTADRSPWFFTWSYVVEVLAPLDTATLRSLFHTLSEYAEAPDIDSRVDEVAGNEVGSAFRRLMSDPALQGTAAVVSIVLTIIGLLLTLRTDQPTLEVRPTVILEQAAHDQLDRGTSGASHQDPSDDGDSADRSPEEAP